MIENAYGKLYLSEDRAKEFMEIVSKHHRALLIELREHKLVPNYIRLEKVSVYEYADIIRRDELKKLNNTNT